MEVIGYEVVNFGKGRPDFIMKQEGLVQYLGRKVAWQGVPVTTLKTFALGDRKPPQPRYKGLSKLERNRAKAANRKLVKGLLIESAGEWIGRLGHEAPEVLKSDTADATLVLCWVLVNSLQGWRVPEKGHDVADRVEETKTTGEGGT